ncbi:TPA: hypothetical protein DIC38_00590 [Candidatus Nomurabacteria bacterium]|nr:MAG: hypothetical protein O210_OD1C00001G0609 [Parcubacteria bacterium RAAC4_OD1_1]HCY26169.1 hypothetical protein [Candidatus Nomurabacteria bacterium]
MSELYPEKSLRYKILEFFLNKRLRKSGIGGIIKVPLKELEPLLEYSHSGNRVESLINELNELDEESFGNFPEEKRPVLNIVNKEILNNANTIFNSNDILKVEYTSENISDYLNKLKERTKAAKELLGFSELQELTNDRIAICLGNKKIILNKTRGGGIFNLAINITRLMYGQTVKGKALEDYEPHYSISFNELRECLDYIFDTELTDKQIKDAIFGINKKSIEEFDKNIFEIDDQGVILSL